MQVRRPPLLVPGATVHRAGGQGGQEGLVSGADVGGKDLHWSRVRRGVGGGSGWFLSGRIGEELMLVYTLDINCKFSSKF